MIRLYDNQEDLFPLNFARDPSNYKRIALTFDCGGNHSYTREILCALASTQITASFFLTGKFIQQFTTDTHALYDAGHEIGNHTFTHPELACSKTRKTNPGVTKEFLETQLLTVEKELNNLSITNYAPIWRAPYGYYNAEILKWGSELGFQHFSWSIDTTDWLTDPDNPDTQSGSEIASELQSFTKTRPEILPGAIILMHVGACYRSDPLYLHLERIISSYQRQGYEFVKCSELMHPATSDKP